MSIQPYTKIENALLNELCKLELTGRELRVLLLIIRYTKGFNRKSAKMSATFISNGTGIESKNARKIVKALADKGLIKVTRKSSTATNVIEFTGVVYDPTTGVIHDPNTGVTGDPQERKENKNTSSSALEERRRRLKEIMEAEWVPDDI